MKYMLLIHQGDAPTPRDPDAWARLPQDEQQAVFRDYQAINQTPGVSPGQQLDEPESATTVRVEDGKTLTTDGPFVELKEAVGGYLFFEADDLDAAIARSPRRPACSRSVRPWRTAWMRPRSLTSDSSSSSPAVTRRSPPRRRSHSPCGRSAA